MADQKPKPASVPGDEGALERARRLIREGADQLDRDEAVDGEGVMRRLREKHQRLLDDEQAKSA